ncbi:branched-chain amino acid ABC transporter permease, partial [Ramlibacter sp. WS9]|uniref:branched-chain amino acid ABC transporter permease n=1 Tax=Ramlibacter sp. WS9 TaxID=1882741 RepID=UPI001143FCB6
MRWRPAPAGILAAGLLMGALPFFKVPAFYESFLYLALFWIVLATSWNILSGYAGYFSFGHGAYFGAGVYTSATLAAKFNWPFLLTLPAAALVSAVIGIGVGAVVFRVRGVRGEVFALLTLAVTFVLATIIGNTPIDGGPGIYLNAVPVPKLGPSPTSSLYMMMLVAAVIALLVSWGIRHSRFGAGLFAIHDDEDAAEVMGVPTFRSKLVALAVSCALAGLAGGIHSLFISYVTTAETFNITVPLTVVLMSILGGTRHWAGPAIGAVAITCLLFAFTGGEYAVLGKGVIGLILVIGILFMPEGVMGKLRRKQVSGAGEGAPLPASPQRGEAGRGAPSP